MEEQQQQHQPLLSADAAAAVRSSESWRSYEYLGRSAPLYARQPSLVAGDEVSVAEIRSASLVSDHYYPPSIHGALVSSPEPSEHYPKVPRSTDLAIVPQDGYDGYPSGYNSKDTGRQILDGVEIRQLLIDHIGHRCCWGSRPARTWKISAIEDCNVYVGTLESFIEERETITEKEPYLGGKIDARISGQDFGLWDLDLRSEFPHLFVPHKETKMKIPHSESTEKCADCDGRGEIACPKVKTGVEAGFDKEKHMYQCSTCYGRGLIAHRDGSDSICTKCTGKQMLPCPICESRRVVKCQSCGGQGSLITRSIAMVTWKTLSTRKVSATSAAASVPDEVFHRAKGVQLCNVQSYQCTPAFFADSHFLNRFSSEVISSRAPIPTSARVICERHIILVVPVTRVTMTHRKRAFTFYVVGDSKEIFIRDYPKQACLGLCCCLEWLRG